MANATRPTAASPATIATAHRTMLARLIAAAATGAAYFTASAAPTITSTAVPSPPPPLPWVCAPSGIPITVLLVFGGGALAVADFERGPVDGAGTQPLDTPASLAPGAHLHPAFAAADVAGALAFGAAAERRQVQAPDPHRRDGDDGEDEFGVHCGSLLRRGGGAGGVTLAVAFRVADRLALGEATVVAVAETFAVGAAGEALTELVAAGLVAVLCACTVDHPHGVFGPLPPMWSTVAATAQVAAGAPVAAVAGSWYRCRSAAVAPGLPGRGVTGHPPRPRHRTCGSPCGPHRRL